MTSLWRNFIVGVVANSNWSCLLIYTPEVHWRVQPTAANKMRGALCALHVSLNNASTRTVSKCLKRNNDHLITLQIWMEWRCRIWRAMHDAILKPSSEMQNSLWIKNRTGKDMEHFFADPVIKLSWVLQVVWQEYMNGDGRYSKLLSLLKKNVRT